MEEEAVEVATSGFGCGWVAGTHAAVDFHQGVFGVVDFVDGEGFAQVSADVDAVDEEDVELADAGFDELFDFVFGDGVVGLEDDLAGFFVDDVVGGVFGEEFFGFDGQLGDACFLQLFDGAAGELAVLFDENFFGAGVADVAGRALSVEEFGVEDLGELVGALEDDFFGFVEVVEQLFGAVSEATEEDGGVEFTAAVDADVEVVFVVELEVEP